MGSIVAGSAVLWCWVTLALSGRWRPARGWLDRLGRVLGCCWLVLWLVYAVANFRLFYPLG
jgi:hypothetical protein